MEIIAGIVALKEVEIFHGDNFNTKKLDPKLMNNGNNQEGIGIYFGNLQTAESYGKNIVKTSINPKRFIPARDSISDHIKVRDISKLLKELHKIDNEPLYYEVTDWGEEVPEPEDIKDYHLEDLAENIKDEEVRNVQIDLAEKFGVLNFVKVWLKVVKGIDGTFTDRPSDTWYAVLNPKYSLEKVNL